MEVAELRISLWGLFGGSLHVTWSIGELIGPGGSKLVVGKAKVEVIHGLECDLYELLL